MSRSRSSTPSNHPHHDPASKDPARDEFLTFAEAARYAGCSVKTLRRRWQDGTLPVHETPDGYRILLDDLCKAPILTTELAAKRAGVTAGTIQRRVKAQKLQPCSWTSERRYNLEDVDRSRQRNVDLGKVAESVTVPKPDECWLLAELPDAYFHTASKRDDDYAGYLEKQAELLDKLLDATAAYLPDDQRDAEIQRVHCMLQSLDATLVARRLARNSGLNEAFLPSWPTFIGRFR